MVYWCNLTPFMFICSVAYRYVYIEIHIKRVIPIYSKLLHHTFSDLSNCIGWAIIEKLSIHRQSAYFWSVGGRKRVLNIVMLIYRHDIRPGLQWYVLIWTSQWIFLPRSNNFPTAWQSEVIPRGSQISRLGTTSHNFLLNVKKIRWKINPSHASQKMPQGNAGIAMQWFRAGPSRILILKSWQVYNWWG